MSLYYDRKKYSFTVNGFDENTFGVVSFEGTEALSSPSSFDIMLVSDDRELDMDSVLSGNATFTIHRPDTTDGQDVDIKGVLADFEKIREHNDFF